MEMLPRLQTLGQGSSNTYGDRTAARDTWCNADAFGGQTKYCYDGKGRVESVKRNTTSEVCKDGIVIINMRSMPMGLNDGN